MTGSDPNLIEDFEKEFEFLSGNEAVNYVLDELQRKDFKKVIKYPYEEMNQVLRGIFPTSFIVLGASYGAGKSELAGDIALHACAQEKRVLFFDFENDDGDFVMRQICKKVSRMSDHPFTVADLKCMDPDTSSYADKVHHASEIVAGMIQNMRIYKNNKLPNINDFVEQLELIDDVDLVVIDHLHYFSMDSSEEERKQLGSIMRGLRLLTKVRRIPVVLVSHLSKKDKNKLPTASDFYGSSDIAKEAKTAILLHRDDEDGCTMVIDKNRDGQITRKLEYIYDRKQGKMVFSEGQPGFKDKDFIF